MDYTVHEILQVRILVWVAVPFSRGSSQPSDPTHVSRIAGGFLTSWATREVENSVGYSQQRWGNSLKKSVNQNTVLKKKNI